MSTRRLLISFSGGETSAYMTWWAKRHLAARYDEIAVVFANTGEEREETLEFVRLCDERLGFGTVWIEAVQYHGERKAAGHRVVSFETAARDGEPFEDMIRKYGIPNTKFKHCTRDLKLKPIQSYARSMGWNDSGYDTAIGIRADEADRISSAAADQRLVYPLVEWHPKTKPEINDWWERQTFRLRLRSYEGNCAWCWKKSFRKHFTLISERPEVYDFPRRMERLYGKVGPEFKQHAPPADYMRTFFRGNLSTDGLFAEYERAKDKFQPAYDEARVFQLELDLGAGCEESCEVFADEDMDDAA